MKKLVTVVVAILLLTTALATFGGCNAVLDSAYMLKYCDAKLESITANDGCVIDVTGDVYSVAFCKVDGDKITVDYVNHDDVTITANVTDNDRVEIVQTFKTVTALNLRCYIVVGIPKNWTNCSIYVDFEAGSVNVENLQLKTLHLDVNAGGVNARCNATDNIYVNVKAGGVTLEGQSPRVSISADAGSINANVTSDKVMLQGEAGSINCDVKQATEIVLSNMAGAINAKIQGEQSAFAITTHVDVGSCNVSEQTGDGVHKLDVTVNVGGASIEFYS